MTLRNDRRLAFALVAAVVAAWFLWPWSPRPNRPATKWVKGRQTACAIPARAEPTVWMVTFYGATA